MEVVYLVRGVDDINFRLKKKDEKTPENKVYVIMRELPFGKKCPNLNDFTCQNTGTTYIILGCYYVDNNKLNLWKYVFLGTDFLKDNNIEKLNKYVFGGDIKYFNLVEGSRIKILNNSTPINTENVYNMLCFINKNNTKVINPNDIFNKNLELINCFDEGKLGNKLVKKIGKKSSLLLIIIICSVFFFLFFVIGISSLVYLHKKKRLR